MKRGDDYQKTYGPSRSKTYETSLFNLIQSEFGYIGGPDVVKLFVQKICDLNREYYKQEEYVRPGEMRYLALKAGQKYARGRKLSEMQLVPVTLTVISPDDIEDRVNRLPRKERMKKITARILREASPGGGAKRDRHSDNLQGELLCRIKLCTGIRERTPGSASQTRNGDGHGKDADA